MRNTDILPRYNKGYFFFENHPMTPPISPANATSIVTGVLNELNTWIALSAWLNTVTGRAISSGLCS
jgi:hypothetical protein